MLQKLKTILWKNVLIRRRHWLLTLTEILMPILLFSLVAYGRSKVSGLRKIHYDEPTYHEITTLEDIYSHLDVGELSLLYSPHTDFNEKIIRNAQEKLQIPGDAIHPYDTRKELLQNFGKNSTSLVAIVNFKSNISKHLDYDLTLYDKYLLWNTKKLFSSMFTLEDTRSSKYLYKGYAALQTAIDMAFLESQLNQNLASILFSVQEFPDPPRTVDSGLTQLFMYFLPLITIFSFIFLCPAVLQRVGEEKQSGTKEFMKMVGMNSWMIWLGWLIHALSTNLLSIIFIVVLMKIPLWGVSYPPVEYSDGTVLFVFLFLYCMAAITFCFFIGSFFNTPSVASVIGILLWIFSYFVPQTFLRSHEYLPWKFKIPLAIFPNMALHFGYSSISVFEMREVGSQWSNIFLSSTGSEDDITMGNVFIMLIFDMVIFMLFTLYLENVKPGEYGIAKSYFFPITSLKNLITINKRVENSSESKSLNTDIEQGKVPCIEVHHLHKKYKNNVAVDDLNMNIYSNEITVLLGHNGAGKTTTMSVLTGMISSTSGYILIEGKDIQKHTGDVRKTMGLCPQHNLIFPDLTVSEHLRFFAMLKGIQNPCESADDILRKLGIEDKKESLACTLSGGTKRKLCLGMALIGNSKVLILDEPTSGMDPESRRKIWDLLLQYRKSKTILITTHFMEEADVLGDRIAIMANGHLQCYDTPLRLKIKYDTGYHLSIFVKSTKHVREITSAVKHHVQDARVIQESEDTLVYLLPFNKDKTNGTKYRDLCRVLETNKNKWDIVTIGLNLTTLNDVFLKVKDEVDGASDTKAQGKLNDGFEKHPSLKGIARHYCSFRSLMAKRIHFLKKKFYWFIPPTIVAVCILMLIMWLGMSNGNSKSGEPPLNLTLEAYGNTQVYYGGRNSSNPKLTRMRNLYSQDVMREHGKLVFQEDVSAGIIQMGIKNIAFYKNHMVVASEFNDTEDDEIVVNAMYSSNSLHGLPISINLATNALGKALLNESFSISTTNVPLKPLHSDYNPSEMSVVSVMSVWLILMPLSVLFLTSNFIIFPHTEVSTNFIQIQTFAGIRTYLYWLSNLLFDFFFTIPLIIVLFLAMYLSDCLLYNSATFRLMDLGIIAVIFFWYIMMSMPFTYLLSYRKTLTGGFTLLIMLGIFAGIIPTIIIVAMEFSRQQYYIQIAHYLKHVLFPFVPPFSLSYVIVRFAKKYVENFNWKYMDPNKRNFICDTEPNPCCNDESSFACNRYQNYLLNDELGLIYDLTEMLIPFVVYFLILLAIPTDPFKKFVHYVKYWREFILPYKKTSVKKNCEQNHELTNISSDKGSTTLYVKNLKKSFGRNEIVKNLKFQLKKNKCFGLLGVNGAGKSTTFRMLTKNLFFDDGEITLSEQQPINISQPKYCEKIGYCPQEDCLNFFLTGRELLLCVARLKGYSEIDANSVTDALLEYFELDKYANKPCSDYSGGNKRKLCTCLAFLGFPDVILLDEPTSGVDPASRRNFWNILKSYKNTKDTSVLLCSHSMEECEKLCDEIAIMKDGEIKAQGSLLSLKHEYQNGFKVTIKLKNTSDDQIELIRSEVLSKLSGEVVEEYGESLTYEVKHRTLDQIFDFLEKLKTEKENSVEDYIVNQISLEDVFLNVAKQNDT